MKIDSALTKDDLEQHWTNNYNFENKESILTINIQKAVEQTKQNWMWTALIKQRKYLH